MFASSRGSHLRGWGESHGYYILPTANGSGGDCHDGRVNQLWPPILSVCIIKLFWVLVVFVWILEKKKPETKAYMQLTYLGNDPRVQKTHRSKQKRGKPTLRMHCQIGHGQLAADSAGSSEEPSGMLPERSTQGIKGGNIYPPAKCPPLVKGGPMGT